MAAVSGELAIVGVYFFPNKPASDRQEFVDRVAVPPFLPHAYKTGVSWKTRKICQITYTYIRFRVNPRPERSLWTHVQCGSGRR